MRHIASQYVVCNTVNFNTTQNIPAWESLSVNSLRDLKTVGANSFGLSVLRPPIDPNTQLLYFIYRCLLY